MDSIDKKKFDEAKPIEEPKPEFVAELAVTENNIEKLLADMNHPVKAQQHLAMQIKAFLDRKIEKEMATDGILTDHTRRWVETFDKLCENIQKALYGDKHVNMNVSVTHNDIMAKIREVSKSDSGRRRNKTDDAKD